MSKIIKADADDDVPRKPRSKKTSAGAKAYELSMEERNGYLYASVLCREMTVESKAAYLREIADKCAQINCRGVIVSRTVPDCLPEGPIYPVAVSAQQAFGDTRLAFVNSGLGTHGSLKFFTEAYKSLGGSCGVFDSVADAEKWMRASTF